MKRHILVLAILFTFVAVETVVAERDQTQRDPAQHYLSSVLDISEENTYPNASQKEDMPEPNELTKKLLEDAEVQVNNPKLMKMLNETDLNPSPIAIGYRGMIYMGNWPLNYESEEQTITWEYQKVNRNEKNNKNGYETKQIQYNQQQERKVVGALTTKIDRPDQVKSMILLEAQKQAEVPLSFQTVIGAGTEIDLTYGVPRKKTGVLEAFAPAVHEKGKVTFGKVYIKLKGSKKEIVIQDVTEKEVGAWIPIQNRITMTFRAQ